MNETMKHMRDGLYEQLVKEGRTCGYTKGMLILAWAGQILAGIAKGGLPRGVNSIEELESVKVHDVRNPSGHRLHEDYDTLRQITVMYYFNEVDHSMEHNAVKHNKHQFPVHRTKDI